MIDKEAQLNEIFRHRLLENGAKVEGYHWLAKRNIEIEDSLTKIQTARNVFFGWLESLINADESNFPSWFNCINARWIKYGADFDWRDGETYHKFYVWLVDYLEYLRDFQT